MQPKQIIYPINYIKIFFSIFSINNPTINFLKKIRKIIYYKNKNFFLLGRARSGIFIAVKESISIEKRIILLSPFTIPDVVNLVLKSGGIPKFFDYKKETLDICNFSLLDLVYKHKTKIAAIIITHYQFNQINYKKIYSICKKKNIRIIEDCAISMSGKSGKFKIGSFADFAIYSFSSFKFLNYFLGGLLSYNKKYQSSINRYRNWKQLSFFHYIPQIVKTIKFQILTSNFIFKFFTIKLLKKNFNKKQFLDKIPNKSNFFLDTTYFSRLPEMAIKEISEKIDNYKNNLTHRRKISLVYCKFLRNISVSKNNDLVKRISTGECSCYLILAKNIKHRTFIRSELANINFDVGKFFYNNCAKISNFKNIDGSTKNLDSLIKRLIILPTHPRITEKYAELLSKNILKLY
jgi:dTDP-4-amino-4,6-dideoxygalactose transaminase